MARLTIDLPADLGAEGRVATESPDRHTDDRAAAAGVDATPDHERATGSEPPLIQRWARCWAGA